MAILILGIDVGHKKIGYPFKETGDEIRTGICEIKQALETIRYTTGIDPRPTLNGKLTVDLDNWEIVIPKQTFQELLNLIESKGYKIEIIEIHRKTV